MTRNWFAILVAALLVLFSATTDLSAQAPREGITVHGNWVLEVTNPDGTLAERREFENALSPGVGDRLLTQLLTRGRTMGLWGIGLYSDVNPWPFGTSNRASIIEEADSGAPGPSVFKTLIVSAADNSSNADGSLNLVYRDASNALRIVLKGTATAVAAGSISSVSTLANTCSANVAANSCVGSVYSMGYGFTGTLVKNAAGVPTPLPLVREQSVTVTVIISFSSPSGGN